MFTQKTNQIILNVQIFHTSVHLKRSDVLLHFYPSQRVRTQSADQSLKNVFKTFMSTSALWEATTRQTVPSNFTRMKLSAVYCSRENRKTPHVERIIANW